MSKKSGKLLRPGDTVYVTDLCYDSEFGELEIGYRDLEFWSGIAMTKEAAILIMWKARRDGVFFYKNVRHIMVEPRREYGPYITFEPGEFITFEPGELDV